MSLTASLSPLPSVTHQPSGHRLPPIPSSSVAQVRTLFPLLLSLLLLTSSVLAKLRRCAVEANAVPSLSVNWKGKTTKELTESVPFFREIVTGPFEKLIKVTMKLPLTGPEYSEKIEFYKDDVISKTGKAVIENKLLGESVLESMMGKNGVSPATRLSLAERLSQLMMKNKV